MATTWRAIGGKCRALMRTAAKSSAATSSEAAAGAAVAGKPSKRPSPLSSDGTSTTKKMNKGILKVVPVSPALGDFLGSSEAARTEAVQKIWQYIKLHNLQNPANKREVFCDEKLKTIFSGKDKVNFLEISRLLSQHFVKSS